MMRKFKFKVKRLVYLEFEVDPQVLDYDDPSMIGESIAYILGGRETWKNMVLTLYGTNTDGDDAERIINNLNNALTDTLHFIKIFTK